MPHPNAHSPDAPTSPRTTARAAGALYVVIIVGGAFAQMAVRDRLVVPGDAAATAANILRHELLYRLGFAVEVFYLLCSIPLKLLLYRIFGVVNRDLALAMILFAAIGSAIQGVILLAHYAPLTLLGERAAVAAFTPQERAAAAYVAIRLFDYGYMIALAFFGCFCAILGTLIVRSTFFIRPIGVLLAVQGVAYLTNSFAHFVSPPLGARLFPLLLATAVGEVSFGLALLVYGVNPGRWWGERAARPEPAASTT